MRTDYNRIPNTSEGGGGKKEIKAYGIHIDTKRMNAGDSVDVEAARKHHSVFLHLSSYLPLPPSPTPTSTSEAAPRLFVALCTFKAPRLLRNERFNTTIKVRA